MTLNARQALVGVANSPKARAPGAANEEAGGQRERLFARSRRWGAPPGRISSGPTDFGTAVLLREGGAGV
eukprot:8444813-Alexandrium_andersonii.AAC.1